LIGAYFEAKRQIFNRYLKFAFLPASLKHSSREARHPAPFSFYLLIAGSGQIVLINKLILDASGWRSPAPDRQP